jgi:hypothetical protein
MGFFFWDGVGILSVQFAGQIIQVPMEADGGLEGSLLRYKGRSRLEYSEESDRRELHGGYFMILLQLLVSKEKISVTAFSTRGQDLPHISNSKIH